jgi:hypothetical protein
MIGIRASYAFHAARSLLKRSVAHGEDSGHSLLQFEDCSAQDFDKVLGFLIESDSAYLEDLEAHLCMSKSLQNEFGTISGLSDWSSAWAKTISAAILAKKKTRADHISAEMLPASTSIVKDSMLNNIPNDAVKVKAEEFDKAGKEKETLTDAGSSLKYTFADVYCLNDLKYSAGQKKKETSAPLWSAADSDKPATCATTTTTAATAQANMDDGDGVTATAGNELAATGQKNGDDSAAVQDATATATDTKSDDGDNINVLDIISIQGQIQTHLLMVAASHDAQSLRH